MRCIEEAASRGLPGVGGGGGNDGEGAQAALVERVLTKAVAMERAVEAAAARAMVAAEEKEVARIEAVVEVLAAGEEARRLRWPRRGRHGRW